MTDEGLIKRAICEYLESKGYLFTLHCRSRQKFKSKYTRDGMPDIMGVCPGGRALFIEVKKPGGMLSIEQHKILEQAKAMGAIAIVATGIEDVREGLGIEP